MLSPRLTNCPECANIPSLLKKIDCKLAELGNNLYNNISYMLNKPVPSSDILQLIGYRRILMHKYCNPNYVEKYSVQMIASRVIRLTAGCVSKCNELERCLEEPCDIKIVPNPTTTSTSTLPPSTTTTSTTVVPTTTTTSSSSTSTTTSTSSSTSTTTTTTLTPTTTTTTTVEPTTTTTSSSTSTSTTTVTTTEYCSNCINNDVTIGTQVWTGCNLNVTTFRNGDPIPQVTDPTAWAALTTPAWCYYNNDSGNDVIYGKLYNWYAVNDPRGLAPVGYHIPTNSEHLTLVSYLGGSTLAGGPLKQIGICRWNDPNIGATDDYGFTALPGGGRGDDGTFGGINIVAPFWSSTLEGPDSSKSLILYRANTDALTGFSYNKEGCSIRLIKDTEPTTTTTTSTTCNPSSAHPYSYQLIGGTQGAFSSPNFINSFTEACASQACLTAGTCIEYLGINTRFDASPAEIGMISYLEPTGCVERPLDDGYYIFNYGGTNFVIGQIIDNTIVDFPICPTTTTSSSSTTTTSTTCQPSHPYQNNLISKITTSPTSFIGSLVEACAAADCLNAATCLVGGVSLPYWDSLTPPIGAVAYGASTGCDAPDTTGYYVIDISGTYTVVEMLTGVIQSYPTC